MIATANKMILVALPSKPFVTNLAMIAQISMKTSINAKTDAKWKMLPTLQKLRVMVQSQLRITQFYLSFRSTDCSSSIVGSSLYLNLNLSPSSSTVLTVESVYKKKNMI